MITVGQKLEPTNGSGPPSGNASDRNSAGTSAAATRTSARVVRLASHHAAAPIARNSPATGLASVVPIASRTASTSRRCVAARTVASPNVTPSPNASRPVIRFSEVAAANQMTPGRPSA